MTVISHTTFEFVELAGRRSANPLSPEDAASSVRIVELERTTNRTAHRHPVSEEVVYVAAGSGEVWIDGTTHPVTAGDVVRIPVGVAHATIPAEGSQMRLVCFFPHPDLASNLEETDLTVT
jgi:quercetin dioxygenase-like cupin family protein